MKQCFLIIIVIGVCHIGCNTTKEKYSQSYMQIRDYLKEAGINNTDMIYFYSLKPRMPLPNVYCFNREGIQVSSPAQCFQYIADYITLLNDSIVPIKKQGQNLQNFLDSIPVIDVYDRVVTRKDLNGYEYYLFIDYIAMPVTSFQQTLLNAKKAVLKSRKKIRLFLIHAISDKNKQSFSK